MTITTPLGHVLRDDEGMRLEFVRDYADPVEDVWSAITESERLARWLGTWTGDPATGFVELRMTAEEGSAAQRVAILECEPPRRLVVETPSPDGAWHLTVTLDPVRQGTRLVFVHRLAEPYDAGSIGPGWHFYLDRLDAVVASGPVPADWDAYYPALQESYPLPG